MRLDELVDSLLYEGYALYPYTPGTAKNATPTPFGIVYPPVYAAECPGAHDRARLECHAVRGSTVRATVRFLEPRGVGHEASEGRVELGPIACGEGTTEDLPQARFTLRWEHDGLVRCCVHNTASVPAGLDRRRALDHALVSVHILLRIEGGHFLSPLEAEHTSVNTWPVLVTANDDAILGAAIVLPDHPQIAARSHGNLFDNTEIEEALVLHVHSLTEFERQAVTDPVVEEMLERALALSADDIIGLHGGLAEVDNQPGEDRITVDGVTFTKGAKILLKPGTDRDVYDRMLDGRRATLERIYVDFDDRVHLAVTVDDDPGQTLMRETGRYLFFFAHEVQPL
jgi:hypothetical protein